MKILQVSTQIFPCPPLEYGGLEAVVADLAHCLGELGHEVDVLCPKGSVGDKFTVITPTDPQPSNPEAEAYEAVKDTLGQYDIIHNHGWGGYGYVYKRGPNPKARVLSTLHGPMPFLTPPVGKPCFVAASQAHADDLAAERHFTCRVVPHGINLDSYTYQEKKEPYLLYLARVSYEKGAWHFVDLCRKLGWKGFVAGEDQFVQDPVHYVRTVMADCAASNGLVQYLGAVPRDLKVELLRNASALVCPLKQPYIEIFGLASVEALACGTPVLSTDQGAAREILTPETGAVVRDVTQLATGLAHALDCKPADCRKRAEGYTRERMAADYLKLYEELMAGSDGW